MEQENITGDVSEIAKDAKTAFSKSGKVKSAATKVTPAGRVERQTRPVVSVYGVVKDGTTEGDLTQIAQGISGVTFNTARIESTNVYNVSLIVN